MLKEWVQLLVTDPGALLRLQKGQLQLAGISEMEERALMDALKIEGKQEPLSSCFWK